MAGLNHSLNIGSESLLASRQGVDTTGHNIANAQTEGFSRQRVNLATRQPSVSRGYVIGNGVFVKSIDRAHDSFLEKQIVGGIQDLGTSEAYHENLKALENIYSPELSTTVVESMDQFFTALQNLSNFPEDQTTRTYVKETGENLTDTFGRIDGQLSDARSVIDERVTGQVQEINNLINEITRYNSTLKDVATSAQQDSADLLDKQDLLLRKLAENLDVSYYRTDQGTITVRGPGETLLIDRDQHANLGVRTDQSGAGTHDIFVQGGSAAGVLKITDKIKRGSLGGLIAVRDEVIPKLIHSNNEMAYALVQNFNEIHRSGFGINRFSGISGRDFFDIDSNINNAARSIRVNDAIHEDVSSISIASTPYAPGDNVLANMLLRLKDEPLMGERQQNMNEYYAEYVGSLGLEISQAASLKDADKVLVDGLNARREAVSGVSMDEEATNLLKWQAAFTASSKLITTVDEMMETVLGLKR
jgi:flagellar hook-associated protein 1 FlgK